MMLFSSAFSAVNSPCSDLRSSPLLVSSAAWVARSFMRNRMLFTSSNAPSAVCIMAVALLMLFIATPMPLVWP